MTVDMTNDRLYWIDSVGVVSRSSFSGTNIETVFDGSQSLDSLAVFEDFAYVASIISATITGIDKREIDLDNNSMFTYSTHRINRYYIQIIIIIIIQQI